ncbi:MAG: hypothetical protein EOP22_14830 [Hyphomicrobiales bacterium]|nr:MAG: hypothetical protein EOP22_14830 [Hyphomicrobiales bacterium]
MTDSRLTIADQAILGAANFCLIVRHPRLTERFWRYRQGVPLFATPRNHSQLVHWRKFLDHNPLFVTLTDKLAVKDWARARGVESPRVVWRGKRGEDIPDELLTAAHVVKMNHGWNANIFPGRETLPREVLNSRVNAWLSRRWGYSRQWAYRHIEPEVFVEEMVEAHPLWEMTFRCHDGIIASWYISREQKTPREQNAFFDAEDRRLPDPVGWGEDENLPRDFVIPDFVAEAKDAARRLSVGLDYVRVDLIWDGQHVLLSEMTMYPGAGFGAEARARIAPLIEPLWREKLHLSWFLSTPQPWPKSLYANSLKKWLAAD